MKPNALPILSRLRELLTYDPVTGVFTWTESRGRVRKGSVAGTEDSAGYLVLKIDGSRYLAHRLAWKFMTGEEPTDRVDHANGIRDDNRLCNLRDASSKQNNENRSAETASSTGTRGVFPNVGGTFRAMVGHLGKQHYGGSYPSIAEAATAAEGLRAQLFTHHRATAATNLGV